MLNQEFKKLLGRRNFADLETHAGTIYGVWKDYRLAYMNPAWFRFAKENEGEPGISTDWGIGQSIMDCLSGEIKEFYASKFKTCLDSNSVWHHEYECSSDTIYRKFHQIVYPLGQREGLLFVNSLIVASAHDATHRAVEKIDEASYRDVNGFICQCAFCRRVKNYQEDERWDWIPEWVKHCPKDTSHTFCPACFRHYYPE